MAASHRGPLVVAVLAGAVGILTLSIPNGTYVPLPTLDPSWQAWLHLAAVNDLRWGPDAQFTYGPLGYLEVPGMWDPGTGRRAIVYSLLQRAAAAAVVILCLRRALTVAGAAVVALLALSFPPPPVTPAIGFAGAAYMLTLRPGTQATRLALALGVLAGANVLMKVNAGLTILGVAGIAALLHPGRARLVPAVAGGAAGSFLALWLLTGQSLLDVGSFWRGAYEIVRGYSETMLVEAPIRRGEEWIAVAFGVLGLAACATHPQRAARAGLAAAWAAFWFASLKAGFVRDDGHSEYFFGAMLVGLPALAVGRRRGAVVAATAASLAAVAWGPGSDLEIDLDGHGGDALRGIALVVEEERRRNVITEGRARIINAAGVAPPILEAARRARSAAVFPHELSLHFAGRLPFDPLPLPQGYQAYTPWLDRLGADRLADDRRAPEVVILQDADGLVDGRLTSLNTPGTIREMLCRYDLEMREATWSLLRRRAATRCASPPVRLAAVRTRWGRPVDIPRPRDPGSAVLVRFEGVQVEGTERLRTFLWRAHERFAILSPRGVPREWRQRLAPGVTTEAAVLRGPRARRVPQVNTLAPAPRTIAVDRPGDRSGEIVVEFLEQPLSG